MPNNFIQSNLLSRIPKNILLIIVGICFCCSLLICGQEARPLAIIVLTLSLSFCGYKFYLDYVLIVSNDRAKTVREPSDFKFEIGNYEELVNLIGSNMIESSEFSAGGHSWVMVMYPYGNRSDNGDGYISFYLRLVNTLAKGEAIFASFKFFILDQLHKYYLIIPDAKERCFDAMHLEWGVALALPVKTFMDEKNGMLVCNSCTLGVEVSVLKNTATIAHLSLVRKQTNHSYDWPIYNYSTNKTDLYSPSFHIEGRSWKLRLYPRGNLTSQDQYLSLYIYLEDLADIANGRKLYVEWMLSIRDQNNGNDHGKTFGFWFDSNTQHHGFDMFLPVVELNNPTKGYIEGDTILIHAHLSALFILQEVNYKRF